MLLYTINNNCASFHLWGKENLVKNQKISKYSENDCGSRKCHLCLCRLEVQVESFDRKSKMAWVVVIQLFSFWLSDVITQKYV